MALDRQQILSELGSVMSQLQNANCGCIGKIFGNAGSNPGQYQGSPLPTCGGCRRSICPGHGKPCMGGGGMGNGLSTMGMGQSSMDMSQPRMGMSQPGMGMSQPDMDMSQPGMGMGQPGMGMGQPGMGMGQPGMGMGQSGPCMGRCDPAALYANTYGYLNQNLVKPVMNEVYNDLKSISPTNAVGNNPLAAQMGLPPGSGGPVMADQSSAYPQGQMDAGGMVMGEGQLMTGGGKPMMGGGQPMMGDGKPMMGGGQPMMGGGQPMMGGGQPMMGGGQQMMGSNNMGTRGMGEQIMRMMMSGGGGKPNHFNTQGQGSQLTDQMTNGAPDSHGKMDISGQGFPDQGQQTMGGNMARPPMVGNMAEHPMGGNIAGQPIAGNVAGQPMGGNMAGQPMVGYMSGQPMSMSGNQPSSANLTQQQMGAGIHRTPRITGNLTLPMAGGNMAPNKPHSAAMAKFSEMFPVNKDLGFDPMELAIQMNPANQKRAAMESLSKVMNAIPNNMAKPQLGQQPPPDTNQGLQQLVYTDPGAATMNQQQPQSSNNAANPQISQQLQQLPPDTNQGQQQQQVYTASATPTMYQQQINPGEPGQQDPNTQYPEGTDLKAEQPMETQGEPPQQQMIKEPIFPAERQIPRSLPSTHKYATYYNAIGQPYHLLPAKLYKTPESPDMPQSLAWPETDYRKLAVKQTVSKTSITSNMPLGNRPSRSQLRHYYRQIKGNPGIKAQPVMENQISSSEGRLNSAAPVQNVIVEKVGGDSIANNPVTEKKNENQIEPHEGAKKLEMVSHAANKVKKNGLQDQPSSRYVSHAWSLRGLR